MAKHNIGDASVSEKIEDSLALSQEVGNIYYYWDPDKEDFEYWRVIKIQNTDTVSCEHNFNPNDMAKLKLKYLKTGCQQLLSNAILTVSEVIVGTTQHGTPVRDIVIMVYNRDTNSPSKFGAPDIICRQAISDVFYQPFCTTGRNFMVGLSVTKNTCPAEYSMKDMAVCDQVVESIMVNIYRTDTLDSILRLIRPSKWNRVLEDLLVNYYNQQQISIVNPKVPDMYHGYCKNIELLMKSNNFMYDVYQMFGILPVKFKIDYPYDKENDEGFDGYMLPRDQVESLQDVYETNMERVFAIPFDYSLDLEKFKLNAFLVMDTAGKLYVIGYTKSLNEYAKVIDMTAIEQMQEVNRRISRAVDMFNKYEKVE